MSKSDKSNQLKVKASFVDPDRPHHRDGWFYISTGDSLARLHSDGVIREGTRHEGKPLGWYRTKEEAQAAIDAYESKRSPADMGNPTSDLPYAIRVYAQARKLDAELRYSIAERERKEVDSLSRDKRDWHGPGERSEAIGRIRWRYKDSSDLKDLAQTCVESEVVRLAEKFMPRVIADEVNGASFNIIINRAFSIAEAFIAERDARALAIRAANVDSLLDQNNDQPKRE